MRWRGIRSLQWAVGFHCSAIGTLLLIVPHHFIDLPTAVVTHVVVLAMALLVAGVSLIGTAALETTHPAIVATHGFAGAVLVAFGLGFTLAGNATGAIIYGLLGAATIVAPLQRPAAQSKAPRNILALTIAVTSVALGADLLANVGREPSSWWVDPLNFVGLAGAIYLLVGLTLFFVQVWPVRRWVRTCTHVALAMIWGSSGALIFGAPGSWTNIAYFGEFALVVGFLPWLAPLLQQVDPRSMRTRLALTLVAMASLPLLVTEAASTPQAERVALEQASTAEAIQANAASQVLASAITQHLDTLTGLTARVPFLTDSPDQQRATLHGFVFMDVLALATFGANGQPVARGDDRALVPLPPDVVAAIDRTSAPTVTHVVSPGFHRSVLLFVVPLVTSDRRVGGFLTAEMDVDRAAAFIDHFDPNNQTDSTAFLVDGQGHVIAPSNALAGSLATTGALDPPVAALRATSGAGALRYEAGSTGEFLATFAPVSGTDWGVVVIRPTSLILADVYAERAVTLGALVIVTALAAGYGLVVAAQAARPLQTLARALDRLTEDDLTVPLPTGGLTEVERLSTLVGRLRDRLAARTAEHSRAEDALHFLAEASRILAASLDYGETLDRIVHLAVPSLGDWCTVDLIALGGLMRREAAAHVDPAQEDLLFELLRLYPVAPDDPRGAAIAARTRQSVVYPDLTEDELRMMAHDETHLAMLRSLGPRSRLVVPLVARGRPLGAISFTYGASGRQYSRADLPLLEDLARRAAMAIDNALLYTVAQTTSEELEARVAQRTAELGAANKELEAFSYSVAHDLRAPLRGINGFSVALREDYGAQLDPTALDYIDQIWLGTQRMSQLIDDLLALSQMTRREMQRGEVDLSTLVGDAVADLRGRDPTRQVDFAIQPGVRAFGDPNLLRVALANLLDNAWKFTAKRARAKIEFGIDQSASTTVYYLRDDGAGFDMAHVGRLFGVFQRLHQQSEFPGNGIGLVTVQRIVERHGGSIWATGAVDRGATFFFTLTLSTNTVQVDANPL